MGDVADYEKDQAFSYGAWVFVPKGYGGYGSVLAKMDRADGFKGYDLFAHGGTQFAVHLVHHWPDNALKVRTKAKLKLNELVFEHLGRPVAAGDDQ